ncbi:MAG TPA: diaminopimelate decarboxylase [Actinobacteria bacterium]|nr:diaminopimelate decarboxylase [bacterium BMS3Bbin01]HDH26684.1 diaminopimelate decarboxylase [Actinomycetota bacterium]
MPGPLPDLLLPDHAGVVDGRLRIAGCDTLDLARDFETPLFVYDEDHIRSRCREAVAAFGDGVTYATKAFLCTAMARLAHEEGMWLDVATGGELTIVLAAGVPAGRVVMHGNNKSPEELEMALSTGVGRLVVDNFDEMSRIDALHRRGLPVPEVLIRVTPGVEAHTHEFVQTGRDDTKFGFTASTGTADTAIRRAAASESMHLVGLHAHIGSQVFSLDAFAQAARVVARLAAPYRLPELSLGGGLGIPYVEGENAPTITEWALALEEVLQSEGVDARLSTEPGRSIVATAAITLYTVGTVKEIPGVRTYVAVDGGMSDNPRPVLYGSGYETFLPRAVDSPRTRAIRVVGKHCESGDVLVAEGWVPEDLHVDDILATPVTGAYGHSMGSNYNKVRRPAVVFCRDGDARLVVRRETYADLLRLDVG